MIIVWTIIIGATLTGILLGMHNTKVAKIKEEAEARKKANEKKRRADTDVNIWLDKLTEGTPTRPPIETVIYHEMTEYFDTYSRTVLTYGNPYHDHEFLALRLIERHEQQLKKLIREVIKQERLEI